MTTTTVLDQRRLQERLVSERARLQNLCAYLTSDPDNAEDLVQEVMLEAWRSFSNLRNPEAVDAWLNGIVRNVCARWSRTRRRHALLQDRHEESAATKPTAGFDTLPEAFDLELVLDRQELAAGWHVTRIWCFTCGQHYLLGQFNQVEGHLRLRCPGCCNPHDANDLISNSQTDFLHKFKSYKPAYASILKWIYAYYIENAQAGIVHCRQCRQAIPIRLGAPPGCPVYPDDIYAWCERCQRAAGTETWWSLTQSLPQFRQFWQAYPRMRALPVRHLTIANTPAVLTSYESVATGARIEAAFSTNTFEVIYVERYK